MIEVTPSINLLNPSYCYNCGKENITTYDVRLSHRSKEELCEDCMWELYSKLDEVLLGLYIKNKSKQS
jgi:hypothetical protein